MRVSMLERIFDRTGQPLAPGLLGGNLQVVRSWFSSSDCGLRTASRKRRENPFFVILSGRLEIFQPGEDGKDQVIVCHEPGEFTGELDLLS